MLITALFICMSAQIVVWGSQHRRVSHRLACVCRIAHQLSMMLRKPWSRWTWFSVAWFAIAIGTVVLHELSLWTLGALILSQMADATSDILRAIYRERKDEEA